MPSTKKKVKKMPPKTTTTHQVASLSKVARPANRKPAELRSRRNTKNSPAARRTLSPTSSEKTDSRSLGPRQPSVTRLGAAPAVAAEPRPLISAPDWDEWRQCATGRIWMITLLTMNIDPTVVNRKKLQTLDKARYAEYQRRRRMILRNVGYGLPQATSINDGAAAGEKSVQLSDVYTFAARAEWDELNHMNEALWAGKGPPLGHGGAPQTQDATDARNSTVDGNTKRSIQSAVAKRTRTLLKILASCISVIDTTLLQDRNRLEEQLMPKLLTHSTQLGLTFDRNTLKAYLAEVHSLAVDRDV